MIRYLVLCHDGDWTALHVGSILQIRHGADMVRVVFSRELELAPHWSHRISNATDTTLIRLADGTEIVSDHLDVVFNRLLYSQALHFHTSSMDDRGYAVMELYALWLSWLKSQPCPVINAPSVWGLGTQRRNHAEWLVRAHEAGFPVTDYRFTTDPRRFVVRDWVPHRKVLDAREGIQLIPIQAHLVGRRPCAYLQPLEPERSRILVAGDKHVGPLGAQFRGPLKRLRATTGLDLFEVEMVRSAATAQQCSEWVLFEVNPFPNFDDPERVAACVSMLETAAKMKEAPF